MAINVGDEYECTSGTYVVKVIAVDPSTIEVEVIVAGLGYKLGTTHSVAPRDPCFTNGYWVKRSAATTTAAISIGDEFDCPKLGYRIKTLTDQGKGVWSCEVVRSTNSTIPVGTVASLDIPVNLRSGYYVPVGQQTFIPFAQMAKDYINSAPVVAYPNGMNCSKCNMRNEYAVPNRGDKYVCFECR